MTERTRETPKTRFELLVELIKVVAWPLLVAFLLMSFWNPLQKAANQLPSILARSDVITVAGVSLKVGGELRQKAPRQVRETLQALSADGIDKLLQLHRGGLLFSVQTNVGREDYAELLKLKLVEEVAVPEISDPNQAVYKIQRTELGMQTGDFFLLLISEFIRGLKLEAEDATNG